MQLFRYVSSRATKRGERGWGDVLQEVTQPSLPSLQESRPESTHNALSWELGNHVVRVGKGADEVVTKSGKFGVPAHLLLSTQVHEPKLPSVTAGSGFLPLSNLQVPSFQRLDCAMPYHVGSNAGGSGDDDVRIDGRAFGPAELGLDVVFF